jgi:hypothetical protein
VSKKGLGKNLSQNSIRNCFNIPLPRKKFSKEDADKFWSNYTKHLSDSITETEREGLEKGFSSFEIERLWQEKTRRKALKESEVNNEQTASR